VVESLDPFEHDLAGVVVILEVVAVNEFDFEGGKEGFGAGVVVAVAATAHRGGDAVGGELGAETLAGVLAAAVGVQQESRGASAAAAPDSHQKRHDDKPGFERGRKGPAKHAFAVG